MNYQVLARKYRPQTFHQMVGQEHVLRALINALDQNRLHHAYLFTGTRGVGKTTIARILAKCLNCEAGVSANPCETCSSCQEISTGRFVDLLEVDAASRTKVEDTRELLENVLYAPTRGRYKVYLIDEVHMLSGHSFNALLKTLEEPPPHVKFLLATTDPQRLPVTVLSRCLQFSLKSLPTEKIKLHLEQVLKQEQIHNEISALHLIAKGANGSIRDALSLLDQAIGYGGGQILEVDVRAMLGTIEQTQIFQLIEALAALDGNAIMAAIEQLADNAADYNSVLEDLLSALHQIALSQTIPAAIDITRENYEKIQDLARRLTQEDVQLYYQIGLIGRKDLPLAPSPRSGFEMIMLRMLAFTPISSTAKPIAPTLSRPIESPAAPTPTSAIPKESFIPESKPADVSSWPQIINQLNLSGFTLALATNCSAQELNENFIHLSLDPNKAALHNPKQEVRLAEALTSYFGKPIRLQITVGTTANQATPARIQQNKEHTAQQQAVETLQKDINVQTLLKVFNATIQEGSIQTKDPASLPEN